MRIDNGYICKDCIYYMDDEYDNKSYCCLDPLYVKTYPNHPACKSYACEDNEDMYTIEKQYMNHIYDEENNMDD